MTNRKPEDIRSIAIVGHGGAGKTSLLETMLFDSGVITRMGRVDDKNTVSDFDPEEQKRAISINSSLCTFEFKGVVIHALDTPGFADFVGEQRSSMQVTDASVFAVNGNSGVEVQTLKLWDYSTDFNTAALFYVSRLDKENADFAKTVSDIQASVSKNALPLYLPIGSEASFKGVVNVLTRKSYTYKGDGSKDFTEGDVPSDMADDISSAHEALIERIVEADDELMMRYLDGEELCPNDIANAMRKAVASRILFPIIPGASVPNIGMFQILDAIADYLPSPLDIQPRKASKGEEEVEVTPDIDAPFSSLCFKVMVDPYVGKLSFVRVFSGKLTSDQTIFNVNKNEEERISSLFPER